MVIAFFARSGHYILTNEKWYYLQDGSSIFHRIDWYRVVLDEAHTIKSPRTKAARAAYELTSHCRWCLTGTPLQVSLQPLPFVILILPVELPEFEALMNSFVVSSKLTYPYHICCRIIWRTFSVFFASYM